MAVRATRLTADCQRVLHPFGSHTQQVHSGAQLRAVALLGQRLAAALEALGALPELDDGFEGVRVLRRVVLADNVRVAPGDHVERLRRHGAGRAHL